ncbi:MAG: peroxiredoxin, partial [Alphaproteobacteria bacterium]
MKILNTLLLSFLLYSTLAFASTVDLKPNDSAPTFDLKTHEGKDFSLESRRGKWTVLYFYPRAETPGCTKQACSFRDNIKKIRDLGADVFGISTDNVKNQAAFHENHKLNFILLADDKAEVVKKYGS